MKAEDFMKFYGYPRYEDEFMDEIKPDPDMASAMFIVNRDITEGNEPFDARQYTHAVTREMYYQHEMKLLLALAYHSVRLLGGMARIKQQHIEMFSLSGSEYHDLFKAFMFLEKEKDDIVVRLR